MGPRDRLTWWLGVAPVLIGLPILMATHGRFPLPPLLYMLLCALALLGALGAQLLLQGAHERQLAALPPARAQSR